MRIKIKNSTQWRTRELRKLVSRVKSQWFDCDDRTYVIHFKHSRGLAGTHGTAWYTLGHCEVYIPKHVDRCYPWLARVVHHELLHLKQRAGGRSWEIQHRRMDRAWCGNPELRAKLAWTHDIAFMKKVKKQVANSMCSTYIIDVPNESVKQTINQKPEEREIENMQNETNVRKMRKSAERVEVAPNVFKASETSYYINVNGEMKYCVKDRLDKLLAKVDGDYAKLVENYRTRSRKSHFVQTAG